MQHISPSQSSLQERKSALRATLLRIRQQQNKLQQRLSAQRSCRSLTYYRTFKRSKHIAVYWPIGREVSTLALIQLLRKKKKYCYLPQVLSNKQLVFKRYRRNSRLSDNCYNIPEVSRGKALPPRKMQLVIMPLTGLDLRGRRLGMGGGYYDRSFAFKTRAAQPKLLGLAFYQQLHASIPHNTWDRRLDGALINGRLRHFA